MAKVFPVEQKKSIGRNLDRLNRTQLLAFADELINDVTAADAERAKLRLRLDAAEAQVSRLEEEARNRENVLGEVSALVRNVEVVKTTGAASAKSLGRVEEGLRVLAEKLLSDTMPAAPTALALDPNNASSAKRALKVLCVGSGRDGTLSIFNMFQQVFEREGAGKSATHEYAAREFYQEFCDWKETGEEAHLDRLRGLIEACPFTSTVGNGYAAVLTEFARAYDGELILVHIRRRDRAACIDSLMQDCKLAPAAYGYYSDDPAATSKRMAAFHFGEMSREQWDALPQEEKFGWYFDKTHALIDEAKNDFAAYHQIATEDINDDATRRLIATLATGHEDILPDAVRLNTFKFDISDFPKDRQPRMRWLLGRLNLHRLATDDAYGLEYFVEKFVAWTGYQIRDVIQEISADDVRTESQLRDTLERAFGVLHQRMRELHDLSMELGRRRGRK